MNPAAAIPTRPIRRASTANACSLREPDEHIVLPEIISKEPLSPAVRQGDSQWDDIVRWTHFVMLDAEELGVNKANVDEKLKSDDPETRRLLGVEGQYGEALGLTNDWAYRIVKHRRQLRREFRAQRRPGLAAEDRTRPQRAVDQGRPAVRAASSLSGATVARRAARCRQIGREVRAGLPPRDDRRGCAQSIGA